MDQFNEVYTDTAAAMDAQRGNYFYEPIPIPLDEKIRRFVETFTASDEDNRHAVMHRLTPRHKELCSSFGVRSASVAVRANDRQALTDGLIALHLGWPNEDSRLQVRDLAPMYAAALKLNLEPEIAFREAEAIVRDAPYTDFLEDFLSRSAEDKSLKALGWREVNASDGFRFTPGG